MNEQFGKTIGNLLFNKDKQDLDETEALISTVNADGSYNKLLAKFAANFFQGLGQQETFSYSLYNALSKSASWCAEFNPAIDLFEQSLVNTLTLEKKADLNLIRRVGELLPAAGSMGQGALLASLLIGAGTGAAAWGLKRDATSDDPETAVIKGKIREYRKVSDQIEQELQKKYNKPTQNYQEVIDRD